MISINKYDITAGGEVEICGLSTDTKPTTDINGVVIKNGSVFFAMDTGSVYMFDEQNHRWLEV